MARIIEELNAENGHFGETYDKVNEEEAATIKGLIDLTNVNILKVCVVKNNYLRGMYLIKKAECESIYGKDKVREMVMYHATPARNVASIIANNFNWRLTKNHIYGWGVSFSPTSTYCQQYCKGWDFGVKVLIKAAMLECNVMEGYDSLVVPSPGFDTARRFDDSVKVKFADNEFLPLFLVFYKQK